MSNSHLSPCLDLFRTGEMNLNRTLNFFFLVLQKQTPFSSFSCGDFLDGLKSEH